MREAEKLDRQEAALRMQLTVFAVGAALGDPDAYNKALKDLDP